MRRKMLDKDRKRLKRKIHIRKRIYGTPERPRMSVFKSNRSLYIQVIDDTQGKTLVSASTLEKELRNIKRTVEGAAQLGEIMGKRLLEKNITSVVFDRNGYLYHGVVKAMADGARKAGIQF
ncbi:MAG TPA: 50S ribosomal protein L18 [Termitinemataceae bacterium]|uniref:50S ribosomal protein L18 n=1 Tax=Treponema sp. J25 TaxID=2094121 RepID=UPI001050BDEA|nr:50S ribosomal protein L18 [Treponema sp. J25]TCW61059.1 50S ribosomal protein L18 [Treponema sp. J25]HOJ99418.1 50S ribosomal protein L18 [Termitinemataceae bacterium]HOM23012.1 50S ribosomal protein L18 [Termitinemataceae bacterium]HPQ00449.1 50S ribosomal protein L18 [Termitinemataceae bacterium]